MSEHRSKKKAFTGHLLEIFMRLLLVCLSLFVRLFVFGKLVLQLGIICELSVQIRTVAFERRTKRCNHQTSFAANREKKCGI